MSFQMNQLTLVDGQKEKGRSTEEASVNLISRSSADNFCEQHIPFPSSVSSPAVFVSHFANYFG